LGASWADRRRWHLSQRTGAVLAIEDILSRPDCCSFNSDNYRLYKDSTTGCSSLTDEALRL
jgi:hypothetical protein